MLKKALVIVAFFFMSSVMAADGTTNPYKQMQVAADQLFKTFDAKQADIKRNPDLLKDLVRQDLLPYVQTKYAGALILGNYYRDATEAQRDAYFAAFEHKLYHYMMAKAIRLRLRKVLMVKVLFLFVFCLSARIKTNNQFV